MATWIAHLRLAEHLLDKIPGLDAPQFAIGNIAPDSGIPDEKWEKFNPPPVVTHFQKNKNERFNNGDLDFYRDYLQGLDPRDTARFSFRLGYFFHLLTDNLWVQMVVHPSQERFAEQFSTDPSFIWTVKEDWYGLDFLHVRDNPESIFWRVFLPARPDGFDLEFIPREAIEHQLQYIKTFYQRVDEEVQASYTRPYIYLSQSDMDAFVLQAGGELLRIYDLLWPTPPDTTGRLSALEFIQ